MMSATSITFAIPYYSNPRLLERALASVRAQHNPNWQLLLCDDSEGDNDIQRLIDVHNDPRMRYCRNPRRLGMVGNWNQCLDLATTDLVTLLHADDELLPQYADVMNRASSSWPDAVLFFCNARVINEAGRAVFSFPDWFKRLLSPIRFRDVIYHGESALAALLRGNFIMCPTMCFRLSVLGARRFDPRWRQVQDLDLVTRLILDGETLVGLQETAYLYRRHGGNATNAQTESLLRFEEETALFRELDAKARTRRWTRARTEARRQTIIQLNLLYCSLRDIARLRWTAAARKLRFLCNMKAD